MSRREQDRKIHMHEYDDNWKCSCGFRLVTELDQETWVVNVKACVTPDGERVSLGDSPRAEEGTAKQTRKRKSTAKLLPSINQSGF